MKKSSRELGLDTEELVHRPIPLDKPLPWNIIDGEGAERLMQEYHRAFPEPARQPVKG